jgi:hypothetical protein
MEERIGKLRNWKNAKTNSQREMHFTKKLYKFGDDGNIPKMESVFSKLAKKSTQCVLEFSNFKQK